MLFKVELIYESGFMNTQYETAESLEEIQDRFNGEGINIERLYSESEVILKDDLLKIYMLASYADFCSILLFENGYEGKSQALKNRAESALKIEGVEQAGINYINEN